MSVLFFLAIYMTLNSPLGQKSSVHQSLLHPFWTRSHNYDRLKIICWRYCTAEPFGMFEPNHKPRTPQLDPTKLV